MELSEAELSYDQARIGYLQALFDRYKGILDLERILGTMEGVSP
jgi:outer membrane protein TolC